MVIYDLICPSEHRFEGWFRSESDYHDQYHKGLLSCPYCESKSIKKIPTASYISTGRTRQKNTPATVNESESINQDTPVMPTFEKEMLAKIRDYVESKTEDVGRQFSEEAKKMHYGEKEKRNIRGEATIDEMVELHEEGIEAMPLPFINTPGKKLN